MNDDICFGRNLFLCCLNATCLEGKGSPFQLSPNLGEACLHTRFEPTRVRLRPSLRMWHSQPHSLFRHLEPTLLGRALSLDIHPMVCLTSKGTDEVKGIHQGIIRDTSGIMRGIAVQTTRRPSHRLLPGLKHRGLYPYLKRILYRKKSH